MTSTLYYDHGSFITPCMHAQQRVVCLSKCFFFVSLFVDNVCGQTNEHFEISRLAYEFFLLRMHHKSSF